MKNKLFRTTTKFVIALIILVGNAVFAQRAKRIEIPSGETSTVVQGTGNKYYVFRVNADRTLKIRIVSKGNRATFDLFSQENSDMSEGSDGRNVELTTSEANEYRLNVAAPKGTAFTLNISIK